MENKIQILKNFGCETVDTLERFIYDENFYISTVMMVLNDDNFEKLQREIHNKNAESAFDAAHSLKGILANTGLTPLLNEAVKIVEPLRQKNVVGLEEPLKKLFSLREELKLKLKD